MKDLTWVDIFNHRIRSVNRYRAMGFFTDGYHLPVRFREFMPFLRQVLYMDRILQ